MSKYKKQIKDFLYFFCLSSFGFCIGASCLIYANRTGIFKETMTESYIKGYIQSLHDFENGSFQIIDDSTIAIHPNLDSIITVIIKNREFR